MNSGAAKPPGSPRYDAFEIQREEAICLAIAEAEQGNYEFLTLQIGAPVMPFPLRDWLAHLFDPASSSDYRAILGRRSPGRPRASNMPKEAGSSPTSVGQAEAGDTVPLIAELRAADGSLHPGTRAWLAGIFDDQASLPMRATIRRRRPGAPSRASSCMIGAGYHVIAHIAGGAKLEHLLAVACEKHGVSRRGLIQYLGVRWPDLASAFKAARRLRRRTSAEKSHNSPH